MKKILVALMAVLFGYLAIASDIEASEAQTILLAVNELIENGNSEGLQEYLASQRAPFSKIVNLSPAGLPLLHYALLQKKPNSKIVEMLLKAGADANQAIEIDTPYSRSDRMLTLYAGWTPMHIAVQCYCSEQILRLLHNAHGDFYKADGKGWKPADLVFHNTSIPGVKFLLNTMIKKHELPTIQFRQKRETAVYLEFLRKIFGNQIRLNCGDEDFTLSWSPRRKRLISSQASKK